MKRSKDKTLWSGQKYSDERICRVVRALFNRQDAIRKMWEHHPEVLAIEYDVKPSTVLYWMNLNHLPNFEDDPEVLTGIILRCVQYKQAMNKYKGHYALRKLAIKTRVSARTLTLYNNKILEGKFTRDEGGYICYEGRRIRCY